MRPNLTLLKKVLNLPTAPFHEEAVVCFIKNFCRGIGVRCLQDAYGNLKVVYKKGKEFVAGCHHRTYGSPRL